MGGLFAAAALSLSAACSNGEPAAKPLPTGGRLVFQDGFERTDIGGDWRDTSGGAFTIADGELRARGARNRPLWLRRALPRDARVEFTAVSAGPAVDIKVELFGDGASYARQASYTATAYVVILGGWNNTRSIIARLDEHGDDRRVREEPRPEAGRRYSFVLERRAGSLRWFLDGRPFLDFDDPKPLAGPGHEFFAFNNWQSEVRFDDLAVYEL
jgi:hypothetical protein